jgi:hypothetical protein
MHIRTFEDVWHQLHRRLRPGIIIPNWTVLKGYLGDNMTIVAMRAETIEIIAPNAKNLVVVPRAHFHRVWEIWALYTGGQIPRGELAKMTRFSKYIISILHLLEEDR